jgi:hypothetical protein
MKSHRKINRKLYEYLRGEMSDADRLAVESHCSTCKQCSAELAALKKTVDLLDANLKRPSEHRGELYWQQFAEKVERRIEEESQQDTAPSIVQQVLDALTVHRKPFGIGFASALTLVMIAFGIWSLWIKNPAPELAVTEQATRQIREKGGVNVQKAALESRAQDYLDQSKVLLIGLMNTDIKSLGTSGTMLQRQQEISRKLVSESGALTAALTDPSQRRLRELISDLQLILVQIANLSAGHDVQGLEIVKGGIEHNNILFKINLEEIQRATKSTAPHGKTVKPTT